MAYAVLLVLNLQPWWEAQYVIPMLGMVLGNTISGISVGLSTVMEELTTGEVRGADATIKPCAALMQILVSGNELLRVRMCSVRDTDLLDAQSQLGLQLVRTDALCLALLKSLIMLHGCCRQGQGGDPAGPGSQQV
jgi:hypothetical protein